jgi:DNA polymerase III subunit epsilon
MRLLVIDTETTGLSVEHDRLLELGLVLCDDDAGVEVGAASVLVNPGRALSPGISALTGVSTTMAAGGVDEGAALELLGWWMARCDVVVAYNAPFDRAMIAAAAARTKAALPDRPWRCALALAQQTHPEWPRHRLVDAVEALGLPTRPTHRALDDARAAWAVWKRLAPPPTSAPRRAPAIIHDVVVSAGAAPAPRGWRRLFV